MATRHSTLTPPESLALPPDMQAEALRRAAWTLAAHAEDLARAMQAGTVACRDGIAALRLFAAVVRATETAPAPQHPAPPHPAGRA